MELLRNYQVRKQLQLVQGAQDDEYDRDKISARIEQAYMSIFGNQVAAKYHNSRPVSPTHRQKAGSPQTRFRVSQADDDSGRDFKVMQEGFEERIDSLEERNARLAIDSEDKSKELHDIRKKLTDMTHDRDQFAAQVSMLKSVVSSERSAAKVLERVSAKESTSNLEFKLEIYKQQILMLNNEVEKLRSHSMAVAFLQSKVPSLDADMLDYVGSMVTDDSLDDTERLTLMTEYLVSVTDSGDDMGSVAGQFIHMSKDENSRKKNKEDLSKITARAVAECLDVMRAPEVHASNEDAESEKIDADLKKFLLKQYDGDYIQPVKKGLKSEPQEESDNDKEIMGLGPNENKMRIIHEREEQRAQAKREQDEAHAQKVAQKLKAQGDRIRDKSVRGKRS